MPFGMDDDEDELPKGMTAQRRFTDFDCPDCSANNPHDEAFGHGDEVRCYYCGQEFRVIVSDEGRLRLKEL